MLALWPSSLRLVPPLRLGEIRSRHSSPALCLSDNGFQPSRPRFIADLGYPQEQCVGILRW